jgi:hypothetical protein
LGSHGTKEGRMKMIKYVNQLPPQVRAEMQRDFYRILCTEGCVEYFATTEQKQIVETIENGAMCSKVRDVLGTEEEGLLNYEKYARFA